MAKPMYYWNGTAWEAVAPVVPQSPIAYQASAPSTPSTGDLWIDSDQDLDSYQRQLVRYKFNATGGETSVSGTDANGATLSYTPGAEQVYLNGALLVRGSDYVATNGTSITSLAALSSGDVLEVFAYVAFNPANTYTQSQVDGLVAGGPAFFVYRNSTQSVSTSVFTKIQFDTEVFDTDGCFDSTTNYRFTPTVAGYYQFNATLLIFGNNGSQSNIVLQKNGSNYVDTLQVVGAGTAARITTATIAYMNGTTDYMEAFGIGQSGTIQFGGGISSTQFSGCLVRKA